MKKKMFLVSLILSFVLIFTGCGNKGKESEEETVMNEAVKVTATTAPTAVPAAEPAATPTSTPAATSEAVAQAAETEGTAAMYKDGVYEVETAPDYEKYFTKATVTIEGGKITSVDWTIYDAGHDNTPFDGEYYKILEPYGELYGQQGKDDWAGSRGYADALIENQDIDQVDAVSGATWTNKKFKEIVKMALEKAAAAASGDIMPTDTAFKDGVYTVRTETNYEKYYTEATVTIEGGKITSADWWVYDAGHDNKRFDEEYYHVFEPSQEYVQQAKNDWSGSRNYAVKLLETQDVNQVDAVSGATWSHVEFEKVINLALDQATEGTAPAYKDGVYEGETAIDVDKYYAKATVTVEGGKIAKVDWNIYDSARGDAVFSKEYLDANITGWEKDQSMSDVNGLGGYADALIETQNLYQVDAVSGATWSNIKFRQAVDSALAKARN